ncbi:MAG: PAS domain S-box protein, partial [Candidatus Micrarchaeota archaeon]
TERFESERKIAEAERHYRTLFSQSSEGLVIADPKTMEFLEFNDAAHRQLGYTREEFAKLGIPDIATAKNKHSIRFDIKRLVSKGSLEFETEHKKKGGERANVIVRARIIEREGKPLLLLSFSDITGLRQTEQNLRTERDLAKQYLSVAEVILLALDRSGNVTMINKKGCKVLGYSEKEIIGKNWFDNFLSPSTKREVKGVFKKLIAGKLSNVEYFENSIVIKSGGVRIISWHNAILRDAKGRITGTLSSGQEKTKILAQ